MAKRGTAERVEELLADRLDEISTGDIEESYREMLDDCGSECHICGGGADALEKNDPIAYRCGLADYEDSFAEHFEQIGDEWYAREELERLRGEIRAEIEEEEEEGGSSDAN